MSPTAGVLANLCVCTQSVFDEVYGDKDLDGMYENGGPRITVLGHVGEYLVYLHVDRLPEDVTGLTAAYVRMRREANRTPPMLSTIPVRHRLRAT